MSVVRRSNEATRTGPRDGSSAGFTIVELLVTLAVASILLALIYQIFVTQQRGHSLQEEVADAQQNARVAVEELTRYLTSLGSGVVPNQMKILVAHPYEVVFNADMTTDSGLVPTDPVPGARPNDPYQTVPAGYATTPAETYRYTLDANRDGVVDDSDRVYENHFVLYREKSDDSGTGDLEQVALLVANPRVGQPLFEYLGDFDGDGDSETLQAVDTITSSRIAAGEPLDAVIRRVDINLVTETANPDPRYTENQGYRQTRFKTSIAPRNLWECPVVAFVSAFPATDDLRAPDLLGQTQNFTFRVTRGGVPEVGRTVNFATSDPLVTITSTPPSRTIADGLITATVTWPANCADYPFDPDPEIPIPYTVTATTAEPPTLATPFGLCVPHSTDVNLEVWRGTPASVRLAGITVDAENPDTADTNATSMDVASCDAQVAVPFEVLDFCAKRVRNDDVDSNPVDLIIQPDPNFGGPLPALVSNQGTFTYTADGGLYSQFPTVLRSGQEPNPYLASIHAAGIPGTLDLQVYPLPDQIVNLVDNISGVAYTDCPSPTIGQSATFGIEDSCGNPVTTLGNYSPPFGPFTVEASVILPSAPTPDNLGSVASTNNPSNPPTNPPDFNESVTIQSHDGTPGEFDIQYLPPACGLGDNAYEATIELTRSWDPATPPVPIPITVDPININPCTSCAVQVLDGSGVPTTHLNKECEPDYDVVVTHCDPTGTTAELVIAPILGTSTPSFDETLYEDHTLENFAVTAPPGQPQIAQAHLYMKFAQTNTSFQITANMPDEAAVTSAAIDAVTCVSEEITVDTSCEEILISDVPDNPGAVPSNPAAEDTLICAADGSEVFFRVKDCDQNWRDWASDDMDNLRGSTKGIRVEVRDFQTLALIDEEELDILEEVDVHGTPRTNQPYFQGSLFVTQDPDDPSGSGLLKVPEGTVAILHAEYQDPDDVTDSLCTAEATLIPPLPVCLPYPVLSFDDWEGDLGAHGGDAVVAGDLILPGTPVLTEKSLAAPLLTAAALDRFFNAYVGQTISVGGTELTPAGEVDQPFTSGGAGAAIAADKPNYFQNVPDTASLLARLDYDVLRDFAVAKRVYWQTDSTTGEIFNPNVIDLATGTFVRGTFQGITALPGPGVESDTHDGEFIFVDASGGPHSGSSIDAMSLSALPVHVIVGEYYTEGLIYVAGSVIFNGSAGRQSVPVEAAADVDSRYDEDAGGFTRQDLPIDYAPPIAPFGIGDLNVNVDGALYCDGEVSLSAGPRIYGVVAAERGVRDADAAEIWYDPRWMETRLEICSECCGLSISPVAPEVALGETLQFTANRPQGEVAWESLSPNVAEVDATGLVTTIAEGLAVIRATDEAGCVAEVEVEVFCALALEVQGDTDLIPNEIATVVGSGHQGTVTWDIDNPASLEIAHNFGPTVEVRALDIGGATLTATDSVECSAVVDFTVNCPLTRVLVADPAEPGPGETVTLTVLDGGTDVSDDYTFFADGNPIVGQSFTVPNLDPVNFSATLPGDTCELTLTVTPACPPLTLSALPNPAETTDIVVLTVTEDSEDDVTASFTFSAAPPGVVNVVGSTLEPIVPGTVSVSAVDGVGCSPAPLGVTIVCPDGRVLTADPSVPAPGETVTLTVLDGALDVSGEYTFFANGVPIGGQTYTVSDLGPVDFSATLSGDACELNLTVTPVCPPGRVLEVAPPVPAPGDTVTLTVSDGGSDVSGEYTFFADGVPIGGQSYAIPGQDPVNFEARLSGNTCALQIVVDPVCPEMVGPTDPVPVGTPFTVSVVDPGGADVTARFLPFTVTPPGAATVDGAEITPTAPGMFTVSATVDIYGCPTSSITVEAF
jgi:prepilin-type N-terminal cleavage/methylation domain-containing protein